MENKHIQTFKADSPVHPGGKVIVTDYDTLDVLGKPKITEYRLDQWAALQKLV